MKISVIFTGGTIGSLAKNSWVGLDNSTQYMLLKNYSCTDSEIVFETSSPYTILSENLSAAELNALQEEIAKKLTENVDGIIVTHGTDTLQYTAAAMEYSFCDCEIPIIFVSAAYPLDNEKSNGYINFEAAIEFIKNKVGKGVFASYKNDGEDATNIHLASRMLQHNENEANIYSIDGTVYAKYDGAFTMNDIKMPDTVNQLGVIRYATDSQILAIQCAPGNSYSYSLDNIKAIIIKPYHSATLNTANTNFVKFCELAKQKQIPIFVSHVRPGDAYESSKLFKELNIVPLPYSTYISAYMKIWAAISMECDIAEFVQKPIASEFVI